MQQNININIVDPSAIVATGDLPITSDGLFGLFSATNWFLVLMIVVTGLAFLSVFRSTRSGFYTASGHKVKSHLAMFVLLPLFGLGGLLLATNPTSQAVSAPASLPLSSVDDVEVNVDINTLSGSNTFTYAISAGSWTEGYNLFATAASGLPAGVTIAIDNQSISLAASTEIRKHRLLSPDTESLSVEVTVPEGVELQDNYATIVLTYTATDWFKYYTFDQNDTSDAAVFFDASLCASAMSVYPTSNSNPDTITIIDNRNGQDYRIRKFSDNHCWMIDNLKLANYNATTADSDGTLNIPAAQTSGTGVSTTPQVWDAAAACNSASVSAAFAGQVAYIYDPNSPTGCGYLYNYCAATADNSTDCATSSAKGYNTNMNTSICPKGWKMPREGADGATNNEFLTLDTAMKAAGSGYVTDFKNWWPNGAFAGALSGYFTPENGKMFDQQGVVAWYWSAAGAAPAYAYALTFDDNKVSPAVHGSAAFNFKYDGFAVRCFI